jgi:hypothetical protein
MEQVAAGLQHTCLCPHNHTHTEREREREREGEWRQVRETQDEQ